MDAGFGGRPLLSLPCHLWYTIFCTRQTIYTTPFRIRFSSKEMAMDTASSITKRIISNILDWAEDLQHTAREFGRLGNREQAK